jgi:hypothetical protein
MSSTRHAQPGAPLRQERYCSSSEFERGLLANLVGKRCECIDRAEDREMIYFLQSRSWMEGGLAAFAQELMAAYPDRVATLAMQRIGIKGQSYGMQDVKQVRAEIPSGDEKFRLRGELRLMDLLQIEDLSPMDECLRPDLKREYDHQRAIIKADAKRQPASYPVRAFVDYCRSAAKKQLEQFLSDLCLNPSINIELQTQYVPWYFPTIISTLREHVKTTAEDKRAAFVLTELGRQVFETLDYAQSSRCMVLIDGLARTGKTMSAKTWCDLNPGMARYIQVPASSDNTAFFRAIARALGVSTNLKAKAIELRDRVEDVLQRGHIMPVFDEAHYLWPQSNSREALPFRINWIMTALVNYGVPVALVTTPQFVRSQNEVEKRTWWTSEQFIGRIGHYQKLPDSLNKDDLEAVARSLLPAGDDKSIKLLVAYARSSNKYLAGIDAVVKRAFYLAQKEGRSEPSRTDVRRAIQESAIPSDAAMHQALGKPLVLTTKPDRREESVVAASLPRGRSAVATREDGDLQTSDLRRDTPQLTP